MTIRKFFAGAALIFIAAGVGHAQSLEGLTVYRGLDGKLTDQSRENLRILSEGARINGQLTVWLMFDMDFVGNPELRTPEVIQSEAAARDDLIESIVMPIVHAGHAQLLETPEGAAEAPGCLLSVTAAGLNWLATRKDAKHISYMSE